MDHVILRSAGASTGASTSSDPRPEPEREPGEGEGGAVAEPTERGDCYSVHGESADDPGGPENEEEPPGHADSPDGCGCECRACRRVGDKDDRLDLQDQARAPGSPCSCEAADAHARGCSAPGAHARHSLGLRPGRHPGLGDIVEEPPAETTVEDPLVKGLLTTRL